MKEKKVALILGLVSLIITVLICIQINTIKEASNTVGGTTLNNNSSLKDKAIEWQQKYATAFAKLEKTQIDLEKIRTNATNDSQTDKNIEAELKTVNQYLGLTDVSGAGIIIKIDDNREINEEEVLDVQPFLIHSSDLIEIVNELFNAGADAVSINDKRIVITSSILCDGNITRVNGERVGVPITIKAIGFPSRLEYALTRPGSTLRMGYLQLMAPYGLVTNVEQNENITIYKYDGSYTHDYITEN